VIRPVFHQLEARVEAHVFIAFRALAPGLTPRSVLEKFAAAQMIDVHLPTTDGRELLLSRYTEPEPELNLLLKKLKLELPAQPPPKITAGPVSDRGPPQRHSARALLKCQSTPYLNDRRGHVTSKRRWGRAS
jgi:hypothetical protein